jgi:hypothetical protein
MGDGGKNKYNPTARITPKTTVTTPTNQQQENPIIHPHIQS